MATISKYNIGKVYEDYLKAQMVDALTKSIVDEMVEKLTADFRGKAEFMVRSEASKICVQNVSNFTNHVKNQEEMIVYLQWVDDKGKA